MSLVDGKTVSDYLEEALELLSAATNEMKADASYSQYLVKIERSYSFVKLISTEIERDPAFKVQDVSSAAVASVSSEIQYQPMVLPVEELLKPISGDEPGGTDCRLAGDMNTLLSLVVNRKREADFVPQYGEAARLSLDILKNKSKDLGVAVRLIECAFIQSGFPALADGMLLLNGMMDSYWMELYPEYDEYDFEPRSNDLMNLQELICLQINKKFGGAHLYSPSYATRQDADQEKMVLDTILAQMDKMSRFTYENFGDDAPELSDLTADIKTVHSAMMQKYQYFIDQDTYARNSLVANEEAAMNAVLDEEERRLSDERKKEEREAALESMPKILKQPQDLDDVKVRLADCSEYLLSFHPEDPLPYLINRAMWWNSTLYKNNSDSPDGEDRRNIGALLSGGRWNDLLVQCENAFQKGAYNWYDLQKIQYDATQNLGGRFAPLGEILSATAAQFLNASPQLLKNKLPDMTPTASDETCSWIESKKQVASSSGGGASGSGSNDPFGDSIREQVDSLAGKGAIADAFTLLKTKVQHSESERERVIWKLQTAEFSIRHGQAKFTVPFIEELVQSMLTDHVRNWESVALRTRVFQAAYDTYLYAFGQQKAPAEKLEYFHNLICTIDPGYFLQQR